MSFFCQKQNEEGVFCGILLCHSPSTCTDTVLLTGTFASLDSSLVKLILVKPQKQEKTWQNLKSALLLWLSINTAARACYNIYVYANVLRKWRGVLIEK